MMRQAFLYLLLVLAALFWGGSWIVVKQLTADIDPVLIATMRFVIVSVILLPVAVWLYAKGERVKGEDFGMLMLLALSGVVLLYILQYYGVSMTTAINASLMATFNPAVTLLLSAAFLKEKISTEKIAAIAVAFLGAFFVITNGNMNLGAIAGDILGSLLSLASTSCWAVYTVVSKRATQRHSPLFITTYTSMIGALFFIPIMLLVSSPIKLVTLPLADWMGLFFLAVLCTVFAYSVWSYSLERLDASKTAVFIYLVPLFAVLLSYIRLGESITPYTILGGFLIFSGVYYSTT